MALGDYILCCKCEVKLIYDGDRGNREWWEERFGKPPEIECPDCKIQRTWVGLTDEEVYQIYGQVEKKVGDHWEAGGITMMFPTTLYQAFEAKLKEKNT